MDIIRWGLGSTAVRIAEEYIYGQPQVFIYVYCLKWDIEFCKRLDKYFVAFFVKLKHTR